MWHRGIRALALTVALTSAVPAAGQASRMVVATGDNLTVLHPVTGAYLDVLKVGWASRAVVLTRDGKVALSVGGNSLVVTDLERRVILAQRLFATKPRAVALSSDEATVLVGRPGSIDIVDRVSLERRGHVAIGERDSVVLRVHGSRAISLDSSGRLRLVDLRARRVLARPTLPWVGGAAFTASGRTVRVVVGGSRPGLVLLDARTGALVSTRRIPTAGASGGLALSCDGRIAYVAAGAGQNHLVSVDLERRAVLRRTRTAPGPFAPVIGPRGRLFLAGGEPFTNWVPAYGKAKLTRLHTLTLGEGEKPYGIALTPSPC